MLVVEGYLAFRHVSSGWKFPWHYRPAQVPSATAGPLMIINRASEEPQTSPGVYWSIKKPLRKGYGWTWVSVCRSHITCVAHSSSFRVEMLYEMR